MKTISDIEKENQDSLSKLFEELGIFFAFSNEQFEKNRKEGVKYADAGAGMIIPVDNVKKFQEGYIKIKKERKEKI